MQRANGKVKLPTPDVEDVFTPEAPSFRVKNLLRPRTAPPVRGMKAPEAHIPLTVCELSVCD